MKKNLTVIMVLALIVILSGCTKKQPTDLIIYTMDGDEHAYSIAQTQDNGYMVAGYSSKGYLVGGFLMKTTESNTQEWFKTYDAEAGLDSSFNCVKQTSDGGYIASGSAYWSSGASTPWILKTDAKGNKMWDAHLTGDTYSGTAFSVIECSDGGYLAAGNDDYALDRSMLAVKLNPSGEIEWIKKYQRNNAASAYSVLEAKDGGYVLAGGSLYIDPLDPKVISHMVVTKIDSNGNIEWSNSYNDTNIEEGAYNFSEQANSIKATKDGGYILAGEKGFASTITYNYTHVARLLKIDSMGQEEWSSNYYTGDKNYGVAKSIVQDEDGNYIFTGPSNNGGDNKPDIWVQKVDQAGNILWAKFHGTNLNYPVDSGEEIILKRKGGYAVTGFTSYNSNSHNSFDSYILFFDKTGKSSTK